MLATTKPPRAPSCALWVLATTKPTHLQPDGLSSNTIRTTDWHAKTSLYHILSVTPAFYKNKILSTQERIEDAYQFAVHMKNLSKINLV
jgi:hypothetical protein